MRRSESRLRWHPLLLAVLLAVAAVATVRVRPAAWVAMGAVAGFALSGST